MEGHRHYREFEHTDFIDLLVTFPCMYVYVHRFMQVLAAM